MKKLILIGMSVMFLAGCSSISIGTGIGYRKVPPDVQSPILVQREDGVYLQSSDGSQSAMTPEQIAAIIAAVGLDNIQYFLPDDNRVDAGWWFEFNARK